jgi:hypothetical protein
MDVIQRRLWNEGHKKLTSIILKPQEHKNTIDLFLRQHSLIHSSIMSNQPEVTLEDELFYNLSEVIARMYPVIAPDTKNSILWHVWHITRIEDVTMNVLVNNDEQVLHKGDWNRRLKVDDIHTGNGMIEEDVARLSSNIDISALLTYRLEVGRRTREIVTCLEPGEFKGKVDARRIKALRDQGAVMQGAEWLLEYWGNNSVAGLVLMPATRHIYLHLNKSIRIKGRIQR